VITAAPGLTPRTLPKRSTVATAGLELVQVKVAPRRSLPSACSARARWASVTPVYRRPGAGTSSTRVTAGQVTVTGTVSVTGGGAPAAREAVVAVTW
jgi:hypothetical protein